MATAPQTVIDAPPLQKSAVDLTLDLSGNKVQTGLVVHEGPLLQQIGTALGSWMRRRYMEAASLARVKAVSLVGLLVLLGGGLTLKARGTDTGFGLKMVEFVMASPGLAEMVCGTLSVFFVIGMDVYSNIRRREDELRLWDIARDPDTPPETRVAVLEQLKRPL